MLEVLTSTAADNAPLRTRLPESVLTGKYAPGFSAQLAHKDQGLGHTLAATGCEHHWPVDLTHATAGRVLALRVASRARVRLELVNGDSTITDVLWTHYYSPSKMGTDTVWHSAQYPSALTLPVTEGA
jgi:hypothetical protein